MRDAISCVDRHGGIDAPATGALRHPGGLRRQVRRLGFAVIALFILLAPAAGQIFGVHHLLLREWVMYSSVGVGIPKGEFEVWQGDRPVARLSPLEALGLMAYPSVIHYTFPHRILDEDGLTRFAAQLCARLDDYGGDRVSFAGVVGTRQGWRAMRHDDLCSNGGHILALPDGGWELRRDH
ncbi:MAG: hypothetical protein ACXIVE_05145 [Salinarimonas sp.]